MGAKRCYESLPFSWDHKPLETARNDQQWLESIIRNAATFTDWWTKARIIQLAYRVSADLIAKGLKGAPIYAGLDSEAAIVKTLQTQCPYPASCDFFRTVNEDFVIEVLSAWKTQQFSETVSRNFEVYADNEHPNVFLITSTVPVSLDVDRVLPPTHRFRPLFNLNEFSRTVDEQNIRRLTLRTHGYANPADGFYYSFCQEAAALDPSGSSSESRTLQPDHLYVGYSWPSEKPITSPGLWADYRTSPGVVLKFLFSLSGIAGIVGAILYGFLRWVVAPILWLLDQIPDIAAIDQTLRYRETLDLAVQWYWLTPALFMFWLLLLLLLRIVVYQRDRYRAIHYGAPDLAEFFWRLDRALTNKQHWPKDRNLLVNLIGHSMGALLLVNVLRILSDRFGKDDRGAIRPDTLLENDEPDSIGDNLLLDKMLLASPAIPLEFLREGRNNYVRSAIRRCRRIYLLSSDRDIVLRYLSTMGNWFTEPSLQMAGMRLGNVYLKPTKVGREIPYRPNVRIMVHSEPAVRPTSSYDLFCKFNYLDCSRMKGVNNIPLPLNRATGLLIDVMNTPLYLLGVRKVDLHGGYFQTYTVAFQLIKFLLADEMADDDTIRGGIEKIIQGTPVLFLPSQVWRMPGDGTPE